MNDEVGTMNDEAEGGIRKVKFGGRNSEVGIKRPRGFILTSEFRFLSSNCFLSFNSSFRVPPSSFSSK
jgi:hypothetical protein